MNQVLKHLVTFLLLTIVASTHAEDVSQTSATTDPTDFGKRIAESNGKLTIPTGTYVFDETLEIRLETLGSVVIRGDGPVTIKMRGPGPAIRLVGTLSGSASPKQISESTWLERMPLIDGIAILGEHPEADGIELVRTMQATISRVQIRKARHAIRLSQRNRNVVISDVHLYNNSGVGLYLDNVDLHQINVGNSHISYNREGGIVVRGGNVRNLHVTGCDIEANMPDDDTATTTANILIDSSELGSIAEVAITGCTIQHSAHYGPKKIAPGGANIRIVGRDDFQPNMITMTGNVLSDTTTHLHLNQVSDATVIGNTFFTTEPTDILVEESTRIVVANNLLNPRESTGTGHVLVRDSSHCTLQGLICHKLLATDAAITLDGCRFCRVNDCVISGSRNGIRLTESSGCVVSDCTMTDFADDSLEGNGNGWIGDLEANEVRNITLGGRATVDDQSQTPLRKETFLVAERQPDASPYSVELITAFRGYDGNTCWVHPRVGIVPGNQPLAVMTMLKLTVTGSDLFSPTWGSTSRDGEQWTNPVEFADTLGHRGEPDGVTYGVCDFTPQWHAASGKLLAVGHTVRYKNNKVVHDRKRETSYSVYDADNDRWSSFRTLELPDEDRFFSSGSGSAQRYDLPDGTILLPIYHKRQGTDDYSVSVTRCSFDGTKLKFLEIGNELQHVGGRGFAEPSVTKWGDRFFVTLRNNDAGYVASSPDGLHFEEPRLWRFDDGSELGNYNTQQHWISRPEGLYLVYTRKGADNDHVFRHRAPLFMARVDPGTLAVIRATEQVIIPERGARLGNFGVTQVSPNETWVTVAEWMQSWSPKTIIPVDNPRGADNSVYIAKLRWD